MKAKALISFAVTAKLFCAFVFAYADYWFSHAVARLKLISIEDKSEDVEHVTHKYHKVII